MSNLREIAVQRLSEFESVSLPGEGLKRAAVAVPLVTDEKGRDCVLLTRRAAKLSSHAGQWAFPGGRVDSDELPEQTALRELREELGLSIEAPEVLGRLDDYATRAHLIFPVVVWGGTAPALSPNPEEVESVHWIPLSELDRDGYPRFFEAPEARGPIIQMQVFEWKVHAPTGAILYQLREVVVHGRKTRVSHFDQPWFARG